MNKEIQYFNKEEIEKFQQLSKSLNEKAASIGQEIFNYVYWVYPSLLKYGMLSDFQSATLSGNHLEIATKVDNGYYRLIKSWDVFPDTINHLLYIPIDVISEDRWKEWLANTYTELLSDSVRFDSRPLGSVFQPNSKMEQYLINHYEEVAEGIRERTDRVKNFIKTINDSLFDNKL